VIARLAAGDADALKQFTDQTKAGDRPDEDEGEGSP